jgi:hypothetical protein
MAKSMTTYWNPLIPENEGRWERIENTHGLAEQLTLTIDEASGDYTRLTRFKPGADTAVFGAKSHGIPRRNICRRRPVI